MSRIRLSSADAVIIKGTVHSLSCDENAVFHLSALTNEPGDFSVTEAEMRALLTRADVDIIYDYFDNAGALQRARAGRRFLRDQPDHNRLTVGWTQACCEVFEAAAQAEEVSLPDGSYEAFRETLGRRAFKRLASQHAGLMPSSYANRKGPSRKTMGKWLEVWRRSRNPAALLKRCAENGRNARRLPAETEGFIAEGIATYLHPNRPSQRQVADDIRKAVRAENKARAMRDLSALPVPSESAIRRRIAKLDRFDVCAAREGIAKARNLYGPYGQGSEPIAPLQRVEMDEWEVDLLTIAKTAKLTLSERDIEELGLMRLCLYVVFDCATRSVLSFKLAKTPNSEDAIAALRMCFVDKTAKALDLGCLSPWTQHGMIRELYTDNGTAFTSRAFQDACADLGVSLATTVGGLSKLRGHIERFFGTLAEGLMSWLSGRVYSNPVQRGDHPSETQACLDEDDLVDALTSFIVDIYHNRKHRGLEWATPNQAWERLGQRHGLPPLRNRHVIRHALGVAWERKSGRHGIRFASLNYHSEALARHVAAKAGQLMNIRIDPDNLGYISCFFEDAWHSLKCVKAGLDNISFEMWRQTLAELRQSCPEAAQFDQEVIDAAINRIKAIDARARARRGLGVASLSPEALHRAHDQLFWGVEIGEQTPTSEDSPPGNAEMVAQLRGALVQPVIPAIPQASVEIEAPIWRFSDDDEI